MGEREANGGSDDHKKHVSFFFFKRFYLFLLHYLSFICVVLDRKSNDFARL
jgi:hypothetical protein